MTAVVEEHRELSAVPPLVKPQLVQSPLGRPRPLVHAAFELVQAVALLVSKDRDDVEALRHDEGRVPEDVVNENSPVVGMTKSYRRQESFLVGFQMMVN